MKGHQIIGELRLSIGIPLISGLDWKVTRSLVSYDNWSCSCGCCCIERSPDHWWVTTMEEFPMALCFFIERSPDHWWVTTNLSALITRSVTLKGHQIIGELRLNIVFIIVVIDKNWKVTRSLVSYDTLFLPVSTSFSLKGHQIIGELRPIIITSNIFSHKLKGHQIIGELRLSNATLPTVGTGIERSPDHWWVTTCFHIVLHWTTSKLKGHQIIGELRLHFFCPPEALIPLKGHQIIGELRLPE